MMMVVVCDLLLEVGVSRPASPCLGRFLCVVGGRGDLSRRSGNSGNKTLEILLFFCCNSTVISS